MKCFPVRSRKQHDPLLRWDEWDRLLRGLQPAPAIAVPVNRIPRRPNLRVAAREHRVEPVAEGKPIDALPALRPVPGLTERPRSMDDDAGWPDSRCSRVSSGVGTRPGSSTAPPASWRSSSSGGRGPFPWLPSRLPCRVAAPGRSASPTGRHRARVIDWTTSASTPGASLSRRPTTSSSSRPDRCPSSPSLAPSSPCGP